MKDKTKKIIKDTIGWILYIAFLIGLVYGVPKGLAFYLKTDYPMASITSGSMWPILKRGDLIFIKGINRRDEVRKGVPLSSVLAVYPDIFPPVFIQMALVGEKTGGLDRSLMNIALFYQKEVERGINNVLSVLEPGMILILGGVVGGLMLFL